jgi:hypothetical protein
MGVELVSNEKNVDKFHAICKMIETRHRMCFPGTFARTRGIPVKLELEWFFKKLDRDLWFNRNLVCHYKVYDAQVSESIDACTNVFAQSVQFERCRVRRRIHHIQFLPSQNYQTFLFIPI